MTVYRYNVISATDNGSPIRSIKSISSLRPLSVGSRIGFNGNLYIVTEKKQISKKDFPRIRLIRIGVPYIECERNTFKFNQDGSYVIPADS